MNRLVLVAFAALFLSGCGKSVEMKVENAAANGEEWKYSCSATLLNGYQWVYVGKVKHSEAATSNNVCYGYGQISNYCTEVRYGGVLGAVVPCNLFVTGTAAYTWNKW